MRRDIACLKSLTPGVYARDVMVLVQRLVHRLDTRKGELRASPDELNFGIKLSDEIGRTLTESQENAIPDLIRGELLKDAEVEAVRVRHEKTLQAGRLSFVFWVDVVSVYGPLTMNLYADASSIELLGVS